MTAFPLKRQKALKELEQSKVWKSNYKPPLHRMLWNLSVDIPPPHYCSFWQNMLVMGGWFGGCWALLYIVLISQSVPAAIIDGILVGLFFGLPMAAYFKFSHKRNNLSNWEDL